MTEQQKRHFDTFGYLVLPGLLADDIGWITKEFEAVVAKEGGTYWRLRQPTTAPH